MMGILCRLARLAHLPVAGLLLVASVAKCVAIVGSPNRDPAAILQFAVVEFEFLLGLAMLIWPRRPPVWSLATATFLVFTVVSVSRAVLGHSSCHCFGSFSINPRLTAVIDVVVLGLLAVCRLINKHHDYSFNTWRGTAAVIVLIASIPPIFFVAYSSLSQRRSILAVGRIAIVEPHSWLGKPWPLLPHIFTSEHLATGEWTAVLFHHDCPNCRKIIDGFQNVDKAASPLFSKHGEKIMLVEVPPYAGTPLNEGSFGEQQIAFGRLSNKLDWFIQTPLVLRVKDGIVTSLDPE